VTVPAGFERVRTSGAVALARSTVRDWVEETLRGGVTLYDAAHESSQGTMEGRGVVHVVAAPTGDGQRWAVRRYMRGGWLRSLGDRYLRGGGTPRPFQELDASVAALHRGVPTPPVVCAAVYSAGVFYRGDLITEYIANSRDLASVLFDVSPGESSEGISHRIAALTAAGRLIRQMASAGVRHPDVNAKNVLLHGDPEAPDAMLLDLDRCAISEPRAGAPITPLYGRLERSFVKWERRTGRRMSEEERRALRADLEAHR
jgi:Lipopolysaccharide kinase (Kdo/WaaP) family